MDKDNLCFLVYISQANHEFTRSELDQLLQVCRANNEQLGVTGMLLYYRGFFMQVIEGERKDILPLFHKIEDDCRHSNVDLVIVEPSDKRYFSTWTMGYCDVEKTQSNEFLGYSDFMHNGLNAYNAPYSPSIPSTFLTLFAREELKRAEPELV